MRHTKKKQKSQPAGKASDSTINKQRPPHLKKSNDDAEQIERAVYDGMQDLRVEKPEKKRA
jgi:hypothetical protein